MAYDRYSTPYYNSERYYDPTAGAAIRNAIRKEKEWYNSSAPKEYKRTEDFPTVFSEFYNKAFGSRENGKLRQMAKKKRIRSYIQTYHYCIAYVDSKDFSIEKAVKELGLTSDKTVRQVFSETGNISKVIDCYKQWISTGTFRWHTKDRWVTLDEIRAKEN